MIRAAFSDDGLGESGDEDLSELNQRYIGNRTSRSRRKRHALLSSDSEEQDSSGTSDTSTFLSSSDLELATKGREALFEEGTIDDINYEPAPSTSRPRRTVVRAAELRKQRNRVIKERLSCRRLPPVVTIDSSSSEDETAEDDKKRDEQEKADYLLAVKISAEWNKVSELSDNLNNSKCNESEDDEITQQCVICFEKPIDAVACIYCRQLIGCRACIMKWRRTNNINKVNRSPLSSGISSANHKTCPLCRVEWEDVPEVAPWEDIFIENAMRLP